MRRRKSDAGIAAGAVAEAEWVACDVDAGDGIAGEVDGSGFADVVADDVAVGVDENMHPKHRQSSYRHPFRSLECSARWIGYC